MLPKIGIQNFSFGSWDISMYKAFTVSSFFVLDTADRLIDACKGAFTNYVDKKRVYGMLSKKLTFCQPL